MAFKILPEGRFGEVVVVTHLRGTGVALFVRSIG